MLIRNVSTAATAIDALVHANVAGPGDNVLVCFAPFASPKAPCMALQLPTSTSQNNHHIPKAEPYNAFLTLVLTLVRILAVWYQKGKTSTHLQVHYCGTLDDDSVFDSSHEREPLEFIVGTGKVIRGFDNVVIGMVKGERRKERVTPDQAYGKPMHQVQYLSNHCVGHKHSCAANLGTQPENTWSSTDGEVLGILNTTHDMSLVRSR